VLGNNMVNAFRVTYNDTSNSLNDPPDKFFDANDLGIKLYTYVPARSRWRSRTASPSPAATRSR